MSKKLLIVESPAKAKTIAKYLGGEFAVKSSVGHIRDLPSENNAIAISATGENAWDFVPTYTVSKDKEKVVADLKDAVKKSDEIYLASDPDREGEAIAWHLKEVLAPVADGKPFRRVTYNEITKNAVLKAVAEPREIDMPRVDAQQARRILDRLVGYKVSPLLWKYIQCPNSRTLSAGRVQSVALRLLVERQREIDAFVPEKYFLMGVEARKREGDMEAFVAKLSRFDGEKPDIRSTQIADNILLDLAGADLEVSDLKAQPKLRHALPPFTTSTLQQAASSVLGMSPGKTMKLAQSLYESGLITYMRTDSVNVSDQARAAAKDFILAQYGEAFYPEKPNFFKSKADAQGAHEAIRPTDVHALPEAQNLESSALKLYDLIWRRFVASQMADARTTVKTACLVAKKLALAHSYLFTASATEIDFEGFLKVMKLSLSKKKRGEDEGDDDSDEVKRLPQLKVGELLDVLRYIADEKETKGPSHYSEASLIKALEENGVGRPSTYAQTIETLKAREYAKTEKKKLLPLERGILVCDYLTKKLDQLFNVGYTAEMEAELDKIEEKGVPMNTMLSEFYAKFSAGIAACAEPAPDREKVEFVISLLDEVSEWKEPKTVGKRTYDDKAFVDSFRKQLEGERPFSARQLEFLVRMAMMYSSQIRDAEARLKERGLFAASSAQSERANPDLVKYCFDVVERVAALMKNPFIKSLREQVNRGRGLSPKQFAVLARAVGENCSALEDADAIKSKLEAYIPGGLSKPEEDPAIPGLLKLSESITQWRPVGKKGGRVYDDKAFVDSLKTQFQERHSLSSRQVMALKRIVAVYKDQIPDFAQHASSLGIEAMASSPNLVKKSAPRTKAVKKRAAKA